MNAYKRCHFERAMTLSYSVLSGYLLKNTHTHTKWHMSQSMPMLFFPGTSLAICFRICSLQIFNIDYVTSIKKNGPSLPFFTSNHFKTEFHTHTTKQQITPIPAEQQEQQRNIYFCTNFE